MRHADFRAEYRGSPSPAERVSADVLHLVIRLGVDRYAIDAADVVEVVSLVRLKVLPGAPAGVAGVMNYRDQAVPVVDLNAISVGAATPTLLGTRIVIVRTGADMALLGLLVPEATETERFAPVDFTTPGIAADGAPFLGPVVTTGTGVVQQVRVSALLTPEIRDALARAHEAA